MASRIDFDFTELVQLSERARAGDAMVNAVLNEGFRAIGRLFVPAKGTGPLASETPKRTGKLARSSFFQITGAGVNQILTILQPARTPDGKFYGEFVREGTEPHDIMAVNAQALRFELDGEILFRKRVHHPGTQPNPYHRRVMARLKPGVQDIVNKMGRRISAFISGK